MTEEKYIEVERKILCREFYLQNFANSKEAASYLGITEQEWLSFLRTDYSTTHKGFIRAMRLEDVKLYLEKKPRERLSVLAHMYGFRSRWHLWWYFVLRGCFGCQ